MEQEFDELEKEDLNKLFDDAIRYHKTGADIYSNVNDEQFKKIELRKVSTLLKAKEALRL